MDAKMELKRGLLLMLGLLCFFWGNANERQSIWPEGKMPNAQSHQIASMLDEANKAKTNIGSLIWNGMKSLIRP